MAISQDSSTRVVTGKVRLSYLNVFEPKSIQEGGDKKYSVSIIVPKSDKTTLIKIKKAVEAAKTAGKPKLAGKGGSIPSTIKTPLRDGDEERPDDEAYANSYFFNASSKNKPTVVDQNVQPILDSSEIYSGCYGRVSVNFYAFSANGNKGIAAGLGNVQKLADGEALGGQTKAEDDFDAWTEEEEDTDFLN